VADATSVIDDDVSILKNVTLGGTGNETGDRHPKVRRGVMIGAGAKILGNIEIGACSLIAAGSVVFCPVPPNTTRAGVPARAVGTAGCAEPSRSMNQILNQLAYDSFTQRPPLRREDRAMPRTAPRNINARAPSLTFHACPAGDQTYIDGRSRQCRPAYLLFKSGSKDG
jgi:hypothetical protein